jgi:hypothetical protein
MDRFGADGANRVVLWYVAGARAGPAAIVENTIPPSVVREHAAAGCSRQGGGVCRVRATALRSRCC